MIIFHQDPEKYDTHGWKIHCILNKKDKNNIIPQTEYSKKQFTEEYVPKLKSKAKELFGNEVNESYNIRKLENMISNFLSKEYEKGKIESFNKSYSRYKKSSFLTTDYCAVYINSIKDRKNRKFEFERFLKIMKTFMKPNGSTNYIRIFPSPGFEKKVTEYPFLEKLHNYPGVEYILLDKYLPQINEGNPDNLIYFMMRHSNPTTMGTAGDLNDLKTETVQFLLLHELCHNLSKEADVGSTFDNPKDKRLMLAPVYYLDLVTGKINFNLGKLSDESVREAYKNIIK